jgi:hypothetical protein
VFLVAVVVVADGVAVVGVYGFVFVILYVELCG